ncbi:MAG: TetR/AcrR family transcriptional regulator [Rhodoglobus sp.]
MSGNMDERQRRTRARLFVAVLDLAAHSRAEDLTVTEIAERAGVHRSTVYEHASSPPGLLRQALEYELDEVRARYLGDVTEETLPHAIQHVTRAVLVHVLDHAAIYRRGLALGGALHDFLSAHFQESSRLLIDRGMRVPLAIESIPSAVMDAVAIRYVADGTVGAIAEWLAAPGDPDEFLGVLAQLTPRWWPLPK